MIEQTCKNCSYRDTLFDSCQNMQNLKEPIKCKYYMADYDCKSCELFDAVNNICIDKNLKCYGVGGALEHTINCEKYTAGCWTTEGGEING